jgi:adenylate cyclase class 2
MRNLEAKFPLADPEGARAKAIEKGFEPREVFDQTDTFFVTARGKLKLREQSNQAWLIYYDRANAADLQFSEYEIVPVIDPENMRFILSVAFGVRAVVRKTRELLMRRNLRLHLDRVEGLGQFGELEAVLAPHDLAETFRGEVDEMLEALNVARSNLIDRSYFEL